MICIKGQYHVERKAESNWEGNGGPDASDAEVCYQTSRNHLQSMDGVSLTVLC